MTSMRGAVVAFALIIAFMAPVRAAQFSADQTTEIQRIIKSYLMEHPEVLRDAITELDTREKTAEAEARKKALTELSATISKGPDAFVIGNPDGKVSLVEFFDYNCGYCKRALSDLDKLMKNNKDLRVVLRDFPILSPNSVDAAIIASAAHQQFQGDRFWNYHRKLLGLHGLVGKEQALDVAKDMGADMAKLKQDASDPKIRAAIQQSDNLAKSLALNGTPSYVVGDDVLVGAVGFDDINAKLANVRKCGKALCS